MVSASNTIVRHQASSNRNRTACATDPQSNGRRLPSREAGVKQPPPSTWPRRHPPVSACKAQVSSDQAVCAWGKMALSRRASRRFAPYSAAADLDASPARPRPAARHRPTVATKNHLSGGGHTGQVPPVTGAAGANRASRRRSAMRLSPLSSPKQWLKSLHSVHTGVVHKMRPSSSQSVR